tara:strand:+ start:185 stop:664 length:480 start_codon:yes stop_codon:yes gene_type:complete
MIEEINGDLLKLFNKKKFDAIVHGANCFHTMGAGIAKGISRYIAAVVADKDTITHDPHKLGTISVGKISKKGHIINAYTQFYPGPHFEYTAFISCLQIINIKYRGKHIGIPQIGCGIGGGDWYTVKKLIQMYLTDVNVTIVYYDKGEDVVGATKTNEAP